MNPSVSVTSELSPAAWAEVKTLKHSSFFHQPAWLKVLQATYDFRPVYLSLGSPLQGFLPILEVNSWLTGKRGVTLPFTDKCAIAGKKDHHAALLANARDLACRNRWRYWEYRGNLMVEWPDATPSLEYLEHRLILKSPEKLFSEFEPSTSRAIRKAIKAGVIALKDSSIEAMAHFYRLVCVTRRRQGLPPQPWTFFQNIHRYIISSGLGALFLARLGPHVVAGGLFLQNGTSAIYKFGASDDQFQGFRPNNLVMWRAIEDFASSGYSTLEFGRTSLGNDGLRRFKLSWRGVETRLAYTKWSPRNGFLVDQDKTTGGHVLLFRHIPLAVSRLFGAIAYRHIA